MLYTRTPDRQWARSGSGRSASGAAGSLIHCWQSCFRFLSPCQVHCTVSIEIEACQCESLQVWLFWLSTAKAPYKSFSSVHTGSNLEGWSGCSWTVSIEIEAFQWEGPKHHTNPAHLKILDQKIGWCRTGLVAVGLFSNEIEVCKLVQVPSVWRSMAKHHKNPAHLSVLDRVTDQWRANLAKVGLFSIEIEACQCESLQVWLVQLSTAKAPYKAHPYWIEARANGGPIWLQFDCSVSKSKLVSAHHSKFDWSNWVCLKHNTNPFHLSILDQIRGQWRANMAAVGLFSIEF